MRRIIMAFIFILGSASLLIAATSNPPQLNSSSRIQLKTDKHKQAIDLPSKVTQGQPWLILRHAIHYLGGTTVWHGVTKKVIIKGPSGRQAVLTTNMPKLVVERRRLIRLPHLPKTEEGNVWISPESLEVIWQQIGERQATYNVQNRTFTVSGALATRKDRTDSVNSKTIKSSASVPPSSKKSIIVVVDAGHGGKDPGAIGPTKLYEKVVTLEIAKKLAYYLKQKGIKVVMTRSDDRYITLKRRAGLANRLKADLFVSIHANASRNRKANGSQVFIYNREASSRHAAESAKLENQDANYLEIIKDDLRQSVHEVSSVNAAGLVSQQLKKLKLDVKRIERAPFYVLAKSHMPSILVETAFISNYKEERQLRSRDFCKKLAQGIYYGVTNYYQELQAKK